MSRRVCLGVVGSRTINYYETLETVLEEAPEPWTYDPVIVSGGANGVDTLAEKYAEKNDLKITVIEPDYDDWSRGRPEKVRNTRIVEESDAIVALWDGKSAGTRDTIDKALNRAVPVYVEILDE